MARGRSAETAAIVLVLWGLVAPSPAGATGLPLGSPRAVLEALTGPPTSARQAQARYSGGQDRAVEPVRRHAALRVDQAEQELGRQRPFERDAEWRRAAAHRLTPDEIRALLDLEQARAAEPVALARPIETLSRLPRLEVVQEAAAIDEGLRTALERCADETCRRGAQGAAARSRAELVERHLSTCTARWETLVARVSVAVAQRQRLAEQVITSTSDPFLVLQAKGLLHGSWQAVAELAEEVEQETALAARLTRP
ncbi:MAG: hypothetical protein HY901_06170 [Deltaproteobacteria bacterium]|nr:hypothetical protein [Deltaproteobacteria bacterium]